MSCHLRPPARRWAGRGAGRRERGRRGNWGSGRGARGEESANFQFEGIVGSSPGPRQMPHLSVAPAPALGSRHSALGRLGRRRPGHHGECPRSGRRWPGSERSSLERHLRSPARRALRGELPGPAGVPRPDGAGAPGHPGPQPGTLAATWRRCFIHSAHVS